MSKKTKTGDISELRDHLFATLRGLRIMPVMGYVCTRGDCPTGLGPVMCGGAA